MITIFVSACSMNKQSANLMELPSDVSVSGVFKGTVEPIVTPIILSLRPYDTSKLTWASYVKTPRNETTLRATGFSTFNRRSRDFEEKIELASMKRVFTMRWNRRDSNTSELKIDKKVRANAYISNQGELTSFAFEKNTDGKKIPKLGINYINEILQLKRAAFVNMDFVSGFTEMHPFVDAQTAEEFGSVVLGVKGRTRWKERATVFIELAGKQIVKDEAAKSYKARVRGYILIDEYTGSVVLSDIIRELYEEPNAELFERKVYKVDLDPLTPTSTDQFVLSKEKAAQL